MTMKFTLGSLCSGIEAASVALGPIGFEAVWFSEIDAAPSAVLAHHYPKVPNLGDMRKIAQLVRDCFVPAPDVLCGGTPCQAFSIAGMRDSLDDDRGNLTLVFCEIADEIDKRRAADGLLPAVILWENVPGVLSTKDNAFGCFLAALAGEDIPLEPAGGKWTNAGCVFGPRRTVAWRVFDAQYFGVAQRRRRVFVVASAREGFDPTEVLFEFDGVRRDSAPRREASEDTAGTVRASAGRRGGVQDETGLGLQPVAIHVAGTLQANGKAAGSATQQDAECGMLIPIAFGYGANCAQTETARAITAHPGGYRIDFETETFLVQQVAAPVQRSVERPRGDGLDTLIAFDSRQDCVSSTDVFGALGSSSPQAQAVCVTGDITHTLKAEGFDASEDGTRRGQPIVAFQNRFRGDDGRGYDRAPPVSTDHIGTLETVKQWHVSTGMAVRRLTPLECHRLQGFADNYLSQVLVRGKPMADGPMYKALGNSWAVPNVAWIGRRIHAQLMKEIT